jgi:ribosomal protein L35
MTKVKKNKMKTHKGMKKVFKVRKSGSITMSHQGVLHNTGKRTAKTNMFTRPVSAKDISTAV